MKNEKIKRSRRWLCWLVTLIMIAGMLDVYASAASGLPSLMNVEIVGDYIYWDAFDGAGAYLFGVKNAGGYHDPLVDENGNILKRQYINIKEYCEEHEIPGGTFTVHLYAVSNYLWKGGKELTTMWTGEYTYVTSKPQLAKPTNLQLGDDFVASWNPVPNAENYRVAVYRERLDQINGWVTEQRYEFYTVEPKIDLRQCFVPDSTHYSIYITARAEGYFKSEECAESYNSNAEWLAEQLPECFVKNVKISNDGVISWDPYTGANAYAISLGTNNAIAAVGDGITKDPSTGRLSCDLNYYCASFGFEASDIEVGVSAYSDTPGNGGCRISGISKITYNYAGVKQLTGEITYGGQARYGYTISAYISGSTQGVALDYEWQVHEGGVWTKIASAPNSKEFKITSTDLIGKYIRVSVTAKSGAYLGSVNGAPKQVGKAQPYLPLEKPELSYTISISIKRGAEIATVKIGNLRSDVEYCYTTSPAQNGWPTAGKALDGDSFKVTLTANSATYYVYARYAETETREGGESYVGSSILIPAKSGSNRSATDLIYPEFDTKTPTVYLKVGETMTVKYQITPANANQNLPRWNTAYDGIVNVTHSEKAGTLTITGTKAGRATVTAYKPTEATPWYYGNDYSNAGRTITVVVYDPNDLAKIPITAVHIGDMDMYVGDVHTLDFNELSGISFVPDGVDKSKFIYSAYVKTKDNMVGTPYVGETAQDGSITVKNSVIRAVRAGKATVYLFAKADSSVPQTASGYFAYFTVNVTERPTVTVEKLTLNNTKISLRVGETIKLLAFKDPADAEGTIAWSVNKSSVVSVDVNGLVTAVGSGSATVTASCGGCVATCTVEVLPAYCLEHKNLTYSYVDKTNHMWTCTVCGACGTESHSGYVWSGDGTYHWKTCSTYGCGAVIESTKAKHTSSGSNAATCLSKAVCDTCKKYYGSTVAHAASELMKNDATGHWNTCKTAGCSQKLNFASHTPDHSGSATESYAIKCKTCGYVIEAQKGHTHVFNKAEATEANLAAAATCTSKARYYKTCACGQKGTDTFESGALADHVAGGTFESDDTSHWKKCIADGCGAVIGSTRSSHEFAWITDKAPTSTETGYRHEACGVCGYARAAVEIPATGTAAYCSEHKNLTYSYVDKTNHMWTCTVCGASGTEPHSGYVWGGDDTYHWKICSTYGCGAAIESTKDRHTSSGSSVATCLAKAVCNTCKKRYGSTTAHTASTLIKSDATGHWSTCKTTGCFQKLNFESHTPDHSGSATAAYAIKCKTCGYVIEAQKGHTHVFDKAEATDANLAANATCTSKALYYKTCECGQRSTETFESGALADHVAGDTFETDDTSHWKKCTAAECGAVIDSTRSSHEFVWITDKAPTDTEAGYRHEVCGVCGYARAAVEIPATGSEETTPPETSSAATVTTDTDKNTEPTGAETGSKTEPNDTAGQKLKNSVVWIAAGICILSIAVIGIAVGANKNKKK